MISWLPPFHLISPPLQADSLKEVESLKNRPFVIKLDSGAAANVWKWEIPGVDYIVPPQPFLAQGIGSNVTLRSRTVSKDDAVVHFDPSIPDSILSVSQLTELHPNLKVEFTDAGILLNGTRVSGPEYHLHGGLALQLLGFPDSLPEKTGSTL